MPRVLMPMNSREYLAGSATASFSGKRPGIPRAVTITTTAATQRASNISKDFLAAAVARAKGRTEIKVEAPPTIMPPMYPRRPPVAPPKVQPPVIYWRKPPPGLIPAGQHGLGEGEASGDMTVSYDVTTNQPVALPATPAASDTSSFDWSKLVTSLVTAGGAIAVPLITNHIKPVNQSPSSVVVQMPAAASGAGISTKTLIIGGAAVVGLIALMFAMRR